jgi:D-inositol-3-phosphate glycosyltransferase
MEMETNTRHMDITGLRIDMVSEHASPLALLGSVDAGGQNVHVAALAKALAELGALVRVFTRRDGVELPRIVTMGPGVVVEHIDAGPPAPVPKDDLLPHMGTFARELTKRWRHDPPDVIHSHFWMSGLAALEAARPLGVPVVHTFHALGSVKRREQAHDTSPPERLEVEAMIAQRADRIVATAWSESDELIAMGARAHRIDVVPCGVDHLRFRPDGPSLARSGPRVVVVSRLVERKGIGNVIEALTEVPGAELVVAGGPPASELGRDPEAQRFQHLADELGVADRVRLLGAVDRDEVPQLIRSADVVACCPWYEPFGLVAVEAMACGVPVVATEVGGLAETVVDRLTGVLVPPRAPERIGAALRQLLGDDLLRRRMGAFAVDRARRYAWPHIATQTVDAYRPLLDRHIGLVGGRPA